MDSCFTVGILLAVIFSFSLSAEQKVESGKLREFLVQKGGYKTEEVNRLSALVESAGAENLPVEVLLSRINEGLARKVQAKILYEVVMKKKESLSAAGELIKKIAELKDKDYAVTVISDTLDRGVKKEEISGIFELCAENKIKAVFALHYCEVLATVEEEGYKTETKREIIRALVRVKADKELAEYTQKAVMNAKAGNLDDEELREVLVAGIEKKRSIRTIENEIKERSGNMRKEGKEKSLNTRERSGVNEELRKLPEQRGIDENGGRKK